MLNSIDSYLVVQANRFASWLQEDLGLTMPGILAHAAMATVVTTVCTIAATLALRSPLIGVIMVILGSMTIMSLIPLLKRYQRDNDRGWSQGLARDYAVRAIGAQEGQRTMRFVGLALASLVIAISASRAHPWDMVDVLVVMLVSASIAHLYFACAEPKPPGTRRTEARLAYQGSM